MKKVLICTYDYNIDSVFDGSCNSESVIRLPFTDSDSLDGYALKIRDLIGSDECIILNDENGGIPFLASLIASANTNTIIITDADVIFSTKIIDAFINSDDETKLKELVASSHLFKAIKTI